MSLPTVEEVSYIVVGHAGVVENEHGPDCGAEKEADAVVKAYRAALAEIARLRSRVEELEGALDKLSRAAGPRAHAEFSWCSVCYSIWDVSKGVTEHHTDDCDYAAARRALGGGEPSLGEWMADTADDSPLPPPPTEVG